MSKKRSPEGVVLAMTATHPDIPDQRVSVYWQGMATPTLWSPYQRDAVRFADEALALHTLRTAAQPDGAEEPLQVDPTPPSLGGLPQKSRGTWMAAVRVEPALSARNGGPVTPVITAPPAGTSLPEREETPEPVQGDLFAGTEATS